MVFNKEDTDEAKAYMLKLYFSELGFTRIEAHFSGSGDSGDIDSILFLREGERGQDIDYKESQKRYAEIDGNVMDFFRDMIDAITNGIEDWWNNDGGGGTIIIELKTFKYKIYNYINITQTEDFEHEGSVLDIGIDSKKEIKKIEEDYGSPT